MPLAVGELRLENEIILIKGARKFGFDALTEVLEKKVHETILEVNLGAMIANLNYYRGKLKPETKMVCMVKASAYGAGSYEIAKLCRNIMWIIWLLLLPMKGRIYVKRALRQALSL